jgi:hypothetical protein
MTLENKSPAALILDCILSLRHNGEESFPELSRPRKHRCPTARYRARNSPKS